MNYTDFTYANLGELDLKASFYRSKKAETDRTILYFHGGGLLYGQRHDLPDTYISAFLDAGYHFLTFDYPLAPESKLPAILKNAKRGTRWFLDHAEPHLQLDQSDYILFGRSAGAYLCYLMAADEELTRPEKLIAFYGYTSLSHQAFTQPSLHYKQFPQLPENVINRLIKPHPISEAPLQTRFALYLYARQSGKWVNMLLDSPKDSRLFEVTENQLTHLPPTFIAHSIEDQDVPYELAEYLCLKIPDVYLHTLLKGEHDFDRNTESKESHEVYQKLINWLTLNTSPA